MSIRLVWSYANPMLDLPRDVGLGPGFNLRLGKTERGVFLAHGTIVVSSGLIAAWTGGLTPMDPGRRWGQRFSTWIEP